MGKIFDKDHQVPEDEKLMKIHKGSVHNDAFHSVFAHNLPKLIALLKLMLKEKAQFLDLNKAVIEPTVHTSQHLKVKIMDIVLLVPLMDSSEMLRILILLEHKAFQNAKELFKQLFYDLSFLYYKYGGAIVPVVFYQGMDKAWKIPLSLQEHLRAMKCFPKGLSDVFGANVPDFKYILFNLQEHDILKNVQDVLIRNDLWTFQQVWSLKKGEMDRSHFFKEFFKNLDALPEGQKMKDLQILTSYLCRFDPSLTLETLQGIESQLFRKEGYFMGRLKTLTEEAMEQGLQQGLQEGMGKLKTLTEEARERGLQQGLQEGMGRLKTLTEEARERGLQQGLQEGMGRLKTLTEEARERGLQQGLQEGMGRLKTLTEEAMEQGLQEGKERGIEQIALRLIDENLMDLQKIADLTGLSEQKLLYLKNHQG